MTRSKYTTPSGKPVNTKSGASKSSQKPTQELKLKKKKKTPAAAAAASQREASDDDEEEEEEEKKEEAADDAFMASSSSESEEEEARPRIGDRLAMPDAATAASPAPHAAKVSHSKRRALRIRRADARAALQHSGIFGAAPACEGHPSSFRRFLSSFIDTETRPRMSSAAVDVFQSALHVIAKTVVLPEASDALLLQKAYASDAARNKDRLTRTILNRHMEASMRGFIRRLNPTLEPVFDANLEFVREDEAAKKAKADEKNKEAKRVVDVKAEIDHLTKKEAAFAKDPRTPAGPLTDAERARLIALTLDYNTVKFERATAEEAKMEARMANARARIEAIEKDEVKKTKKRLTELREVDIPATERAMAELETEGIKKLEAELEAWQLEHKAELAECAKVMPDKRTPEQKQLRKAQREKKRSLRTHKTELATLVKKLASQKQQLKKKAKRVEDLKAEVPLIRARMEKNALLLTAATESTAAWKRALARCKRVRKQEQAMDDEE